MEPWRYEDEGKWETVKSPKGKHPGAGKKATSGAGNAKNKGKAVAGSNVSSGSSVSTAPTGAGGIIDPSASAFTALDEWERRRAAREGLAPANESDDNPSDDVDSDDGFSTVRRKKGKPKNNDGGTNGVGSGSGTDGAFGWANVTIPGQPLPKKPKQPRAPRPSVAECGAAIDADNLTAFLANLEKEYPGMNHLVFFGDFFRKAGGKRKDNRNIITQ